MSLLLLGTSVGVIACGGGSPHPSAPDSTPTPPPCTHTTLFQGPIGAAPAHTLVRTPFPLARSGRLDLTIDWTFVDSPIAVFLTAQGTCPLAQLNARACTFLIQSESGPKPRRLSAQDVSAGSYDLLIGNGGDQDEAIAVSIVLSSASCPPIAAAGTPTGRASAYERMVTAGAPDR